MGPRARVCFTLQVTGLPVDKMRRVFGAFCVLATALSLSEGAALRNVLLVRDSNSPLACRALVDVAEALPFVVPGDSCAIPVACLRPPVLVQALVVLDESKTLSLL